MPSFLSKVFGRKKDEKEGASPTSPATDKQPTASSLLEGRYEAVSPTVSPTAAQFTDQARQLKESPLALFRNRSRTIEQPRSSSTVDVSPAPHLTLNLPAQKESSSRALGIVFEEIPEDSGWLSDAAIGERRLNPVEASLLVQACSRAIVEHGGLETLGLMHPHWYAASVEVQRKLISLYILSLGSKSSPTAFNPPTASVSTIFDTELHYTRSVHDMAAVLRWSLRHLQLEGSSFGKDASEWSWYATFASSERAANYPPAAFSKTLVPLLPTAHLQLLTTALDIISSLAAHGEETGMSGSKLIKLFGLWLVCSERVKKDETWADFYERWENAGRVLEHIFLSYVREESAANKMPLRLSEMVKQYPYGTGPGEYKDELPFLARPRFSTRRVEALFIQIEAELPTTTSPRPPRRHPLRLISQALQAAVASHAILSPDVFPVWDDIRKHATNTESTPEGSLTLTAILDDETIRLLSFVSGDHSEQTPSPKELAISSPLGPEETLQRSRRRSSSLGPRGNGISKPAGNGHSRDGPASPTEWTDFSKLGFGESSLDRDLASTLVESDLEVTSPVSPSTAPSTWGKVQLSPTQERRSSLDSPRPNTNERGRTGPKPNLENLPVHVTRVGTVPIDEAFFDFWSDTLLDPIASDWPSFVVCQLKPSSWKYSVLIIEETYTRPVPPPLPPIPQFEPRRPSSPRPSVSTSTKGRRSFNFSPTIKRFSFFSNGSASDVSSRTISKKGGSKSNPKSPHVGEMGEVLSEEEEPVAQLKQTKSLAESAKPTPVQGLGIVSTEASTHITAPPEPVGILQQQSLPAVPLVDAEPETVTSSSGNVVPAVIEPIKTEEERHDRPVMTSDAAATIIDTQGSQATETVASLPPAPTEVIITGSTPGPQTALDTSESVAVVQVSESIQHNETTESAQSLDAVPLDDPPPYEHKANGETGSVGVYEPMAAQGVSDQAVIEVSGEGATSIVALADQTLEVPKDDQQAPVEEIPSSSTIASLEASEAPVSLPGDAPQPYLPVGTETNSVKTVEIVTEADSFTHEMAPPDSVHDKQDLVAEQDPVDSVDVGQGNDLATGLEASDNSEVPPQSSNENMTSSQAIGTAAVNEPTAEATVLDELPPSENAETSVSSLTSPPESAPENDDVVTTDPVVFTNGEATAANGVSELDGPHTGALEDKTERESADLQHAGL